MKHILISLILFVCTAEIANAQWVQRQAPNNDLVNHFQWVNKDTAFLLTLGKYYSELYQTIDQGTSWTKIKHFDSITPMFHFFDSKNGYFLIEDSFYVTKDGGKNLTAIQNRSSPMTQITTLFFTTRNRGFMVGNNSQMAITTDGGQNWNMNAKVPNLLPEYNKAMPFPDTLHGFAMGREESNGTAVFYMTKDGGFTWEKQSKCGGYSLSFVSTKTGYAYGMYSVFSTTDGGNTWINKGHKGVDTINKYLNHFESIVFTDSLTGYSVTGWGIYKTSDGANTWSQQKSFQSDQFGGPNFVRSSFINDSIGVVYTTVGVNANKMYFTTNGGGPTVGIMDASINALTFSLYPNPSMNNITIEATGLQQGNVKLAVSDILGRQLMQQTAITAADGKLSHTFTNTGLHPGIYLLTLTGSNGATSTQRFVVK